MSRYIDFTEVKARVTIEEALSRLGIKLERRGAQLRGQCPICNAGGPRGFVVTPAKGLWYCFGENKGGDVIQLVASIKKMELREAAAWLLGVEEQDTVEPSNSSPSTVTVSKTRAGFAALDYLEPDHPAVLSIGFEPATATALGIGYAPKGIMRGTVAVPLRLEDGSLAGYIGIQEAKLPTRWHLPETNVVQLKKPA